MAAAELDQSGDYPERFPGNDDDALTADFRTRVGLLSEDDEGLTDAFKAHLGLQGLDGINEIAEVSMAMDWEKDMTINSFKFRRFAKNFQGGATPEFTTEPLKEALLPKKNEIDNMASLAVWLCIQRFMGDIPKPKNIVKEKTPVMTKIFRTVETHNLRRSRRSSSTSSNPTAASTPTTPTSLTDTTSPNPDGPQTPDDSRQFVPFKLHKRSSWKKFIGLVSGGPGQSKREKEREKIREEEEEEDPFREENNNLEAMSGGATGQAATLLSRIPSYDMDLIHFIIGHGILRKDMRDEIYCQICKQITKNPKKDSETRGWQLLALAAGCFLPSDSFIQYLKCFLREAPIEYKESYAPHTTKVLRRTLANGVRYHPPNWLEFKAIELRKHIMIPVAFADGHVEMVETDSATSSAEMCTQLANKRGIKDPFGFSIYICIYDKVSSLGSGLDHVMDAISECEQVMRGFGQPEDDAPWQLYFRKELFSPWYDPGFDSMSTHLVYMQIIKGIRSREYIVRTEEELALWAAQMYYVDNGPNVVPGKLLQSLHNYIPSIWLMMENRPRDHWTQLIMTAFDNLGLANNRLHVQTLKEDIIRTANKKWHLLFSGLFEAFRIAGPRLPRNDVVVAINGKGIYIMHEAYKICAGAEYYEVVEVFCSRTSKIRGQSFSFVTVKGEEFTFLSPNAENMTSLVATFLEGLRRRSKYAVGLQEYFIGGYGVEPFRFRKGDVLEILQANPEDAPKGTKKEELIFGRNERTGQTGQFPLEAVYILPTLERPPNEFLNLFAVMTDTETKTLPRRRGGVVISKETVGRHGKHGTDSNA